MMGLFSKKTLVCQRCGKEFQSRLGFADLCAECVLEEEKKRQAIRGYELYAKKIHRDSYPAEKLDEIAENCSVQDGTAINAQTDRMRDLLIGGN